MYETSGPPGPDDSGQIGWAVGREPDDGVRPENSTGKCNRRVVLPHVDTVGLHLEGQVGSIVEDEGHAVVVTDGADEAGPLHERLGVEVFLTKLDDVHASGDARGHEDFEVGPIRCAEVEAAIRDGAWRRHVLERAFAFMACLCARTLARLSGPVMSATDR